MKQTAVFILSLLFFTSVLSFPLNINIDEDLAPPSSSGGANSVKSTSIKPTSNNKGGLNGVQATLVVPSPPPPSKNRHLIDEDDNTLEDFNNEEIFDLAPPSSSGGTSYKTTSIKPTGTGRNADPPLPSTNRVKRNRRLVEDGTENIFEDLNNEDIFDLVPPSSSGNGGRAPPPAPKPKPMGTHGTGDVSITIPNKVGIAVPNVARGAMEPNVKRLVDEDEDDDDENEIEGEINGEFDDDFSENEYLAPPSSSGNGKKPIKITPLIGTMNGHVKVKCYSKCGARAPSHCFSADTAA